MMVEVLQEEAYRLERLNLLWPTTRRINYVINLERHMGQKKTQTKKTNEQTSMGITENKLA